MAAAESMACEKRELGVALVVGATGLVGRELVRSLVLLRQCSAVYGVARRPPEDGDPDDFGAGAAYRFIECDLLDRGDALGKLLPVAEQVTHLFWVTWSSISPLGTADCCRHNRAMLSNTLDALLLSSPRSALCHVSLQTGAGHYASLADRLPADDGAVSYYEEESPRIVGGPHDFYFDLEDLLRERLTITRRSRRIHIGWSVHRPGLLLGASHKSFYNVVGCLCVYGSLCRHLGLPFLFAGSRKCWETPYIDASDARLVAHQLIWWASSSSSSSALVINNDHDRAVEGEAFNAVNGSTFIWKEIWPALASRFGLLPEAEEDSSKNNIDAFFSEELTFTGLMADKGAVWEEIVEREGLRRTQMEDLANWEFLDNMLRSHGRLLVSREKANRLGFSTTYGVDTTASFLYWVDRMREEKFVPS